MENRNTSGYKIHSYVKSEKEAIDFCEKNDNSLSRFVVIRNHSVVFRFGAW